MEKEMIVKLSPPWYTYHRKVQALFMKDPQVHIKDLAELSGGNYSYMILVEDKAKAEAIKAILPQQVEMGAITIHAAVLGPDEDNAAPARKSEIELYNTAFSGNPIFEKTLSTSYGLFAVSYCIFKKEVIQFWNDDLSDYQGNYNGLAADIARELLKSENISFCTSAE